MKNPRIWGSSFEYQLKGNQLQNCSKSDHILELRFETQPSDPWGSAFRIRIASFLMHDQLLVTSSKHNIFHSNQNCNSNQCANVRMQRFYKSKLWFVGGKNIIQLSWIRDFSKIEIWAFCELSFKQPVSSNANNVVVG